MILLKKKVSESIFDAINTKFGEGLLTPDEIYAMLEYPPDKKMGDLALPCFKLSWLSVLISPVKYAVLQQSFEIVLAIISFFISVEKLIINPFCEFVLGWLFCSSYAQDGVELG